MIPEITSKVYSTLGSNSSLVPLAIKDIANSIGITAGSYATGQKTEGQDRFIDEFGTQAIWLGGIPFYKKITDLTLYKFAGIDPKFDVRNINTINKLKNGTKEQIAEAEEFAKIMLEKTPEHLKENVKKALSKPAVIKNLSLIKFGISTTLAIATYIGLTKYRQNFRLKQEMDNLKAEQNKAKDSKSAKNHQQPITVPQAFEGVHATKKKDVSFTGIQDFMFNPVKNLMILDGAITEERLRSSESKQEFINYTIKEAGTWAFMYFAGPVFQKYFENKVMENPKQGFPINLDSRIIESKDLHNALGSGTLKQSIEEFKNISEKGSNLDIYKFIHENPSNEIVKMAKKADIIATLPKQNGAIDTRAYFDADEFKELGKRLAKLSDSCDKAIDKAATADAKNAALDKFLQQVKKAKRGAIFKNMGICIAALGVGVPLMMIASRVLIPNNREYKVKEAAAKELAKQNGTIA